MPNVLSLRNKASILALAASLPLLAGCGPSFNFVYMAKDLSLIHI